MGQPKSRPCWEPYRPAPSSRHHRSSHPYLAPCFIVKLTTSFRSKRLCLTFRHFPSIRTSDQVNPTASLIPTTPSDDIDALYQDSPRGRTAVPQSTAKHLDANSPKLRYMSKEPKTDIYEHSSTHNIWTDIAAKLNYRFPSNTSREDSARRALYATCVNPPKLDQTLHTTQIYPRAELPLPRRCWRVYGKHVMDTTRETCFCRFA